MDFDDLLLHPLTLFREHPDRLRAYQAKFSFILVDEFQDTNRAQYELIRLLGAHGNVCVGGRRRPVHLRLARRGRAQHAGLPQGFPGRAAGAAGGELPLHAGGARRRQRGDRREQRPHREDAHAPAGGAASRSRCWPRRTSATRPSGSCASCERRSAAGDWGYADMAVLYRTNSQSRALEEAFRRAGIPYRLIGAISFYERREVKDLLAYLRLLDQPRGRRGLPPRRRRAAPRPRRDQPRRRSSGRPRTGASRCSPPPARAEGITDLRPNVREAFRALRRVHRRPGRARAAAPAGRRARAGDPGHRLRGASCTPRDPKARIGGRTCASSWPAPPTGPRW